MKRNPYPGTRPFERADHERFFGRRKEIEILAAQVLARRASLLFAPSGAGKSSLIHAGLIPELTRGEEIGRGPRRRTVHKMTVLPAASVGGGIPGRLGRPLDNVYVFSALYSLFPDAEPDTLAGQRLADGIAPMLESNQDLEHQDPVPTLVVFDQFEELFTQQTEHWRQRLPFFEQVIEALERHPELHVLFSMREDFIAELTPFAGLLPGGLRDRFRLERLRPEAALESVRRPADQAGRPFADGVAKELVDNLRRARSGRRQDSSETAAGDEPRLSEYVEPVHLQIVCHQLWDNLDDDRTIETGDLHRFGDVDQALSGFYADGLRKVLKQTTIPEHRLRSWFEDTSLITPTRTRGLVYRGAEATEGLTNAAVDELVDAYLIRAVRRGGDTWYELAHDRLVEPILAANRDWRAEHLKPVTVAAEAWAEEFDRDPRKLYSGGLLADGLRDAKNRPDAYSGLETEFLEASVERERIATRSRSRQLFTAFSVMAALLVLTLMFYRQRNIAISRELAAYSARQIEEDPELSLLLALAAIESHPTEEAESALRRALLEPQVVREWTTEVPAGDQNILSEDCKIHEPLVKNFLKMLGLKSAAITSERHDIAIGRTDGLVQRITDTKNNDAKEYTDAKGCADEILRGKTLMEMAAEGTAESFWIAAHRGQVNSVAFSDDGDLLLTASEDSTAAIWTAGSGRLLARLRGHRERILSTAFVGENNLVRTWSPSEPPRDDEKGTARLWRVALPIVLGRDLGEVFAVEFSPDGRHLITVSTFEARVWELETGRGIARLDAEGDLVNAAAFSPDGRWVATAGGDNVVRAASLGGLSAKRFEGHEGEVLKITFGLDGERLLSIGDDDTARLWDWQSEKQLGRFEHSGLTGAALSPGTDRVLTSGGSSAKIWRGDGGLIETLVHLDDVESASFDPLGQNVVTTCQDGTVRYWNIDDQRAIQYPLSDLCGATFSPEDRSVVAWGCRDTAYLWWPEDGNTAVELQGHDSFLGEPSFSSDGRLVWTFDDTHARAWDARSKSGRLVVELPLDRGGASPRPTVSAVSWSADGRQLAVAWQEDGVEVLSCEVCDPFNEVIKLAQQRLLERSPPRSFTEKERERYLQ